MSQEEIAVIGAGTMGAGIAGQAAVCGMRTHLFDVSEDAVQKGLDSIKASYSKGLARGKLTEQAIEHALENINTSTQLSDAVSGASLIIEAVPENIALKQRIFKEVEGLVDSDVILASNTSSLSISSIAKSLEQPQRMVGLHFFNPVAVMKLLEIVRGDRTDDSTLERVFRFANAMRKEHILVKDSPGFATSRLGIALGNEAMRMFEEGVASAQDIDKAMSLGYRHPIGPLALSDLVGLDVRLAITKHLYTELGTDTFKPAGILERLVGAGHLGRKTGKGFYDY